MIRQPYYLDDNATPTAGARLALTYKLGALSDVTLGASAMYGYYDSVNHLAYGIVGGDLVLRVRRTSVRLEYLARRTEIDAQARLALPVASSGEAVVKHGAYAELEQPLSPRVDGILRVDGMYRIGNFLADPSGEPVPLKRRSSVVRYTVGGYYAFEHGFRLKVSTELWQFSDDDDDGRSLEVGMHVGFVGTF